MRWTRGISWARELDFSKEDGREVYKLVDKKTSSIQGAISLSKHDDHVFIHYLESATHNRMDPRRFINVMRLFIAFAGWLSLHQTRDGDGFLALVPKRDRSGKVSRIYTTRFGGTWIGSKIFIPGAVTKGLLGIYYK